MAKISIICFVTLFLGVNAYAEVKAPINLEINVANDVAIISNIMI